MSLNDSLAPGYLGRPGPMQREAGDADGQQRGGAGARGARPALGPENPPFSMGTCFTIRSINISGVRPEKKKVS